MFHRHTDVADGNSILQSVSPPLRPCGDPCYPCLLAVSPKALKEATFPSSVCDGETKRLLTLPLSLCFWFPVDFPPHPPPYVAIRFDLFKAWCSSTANEDGEKRDLRSFRCHGPQVMLGSQMSHNELPLRAREEEGT